MKSTKDGLTNFELFDIAEAHNIDLDGIKMMDEITKLKSKKNFNLIINLQDVGESGSHWVCMIMKGSKVLYIDSFGGFPHPLVMKWCLKHKKQLGYSAYITQDLRSQSCGYFCLYAIQYLQHCKENNLFEKGNAYVNVYEPGTKLNEKILMKNFKNIYK